MTLSPTAKEFFRCENEVEPRWFDAIELTRTGDPWQDWFSELHFPQHGPLDSWIERYIVEDICRAADNLRLKVVPATGRFAAT